MTVSSFINFKQTLSKLFPKKRKKAIEDWDFIMVFGLGAKEEIKTYFNQINCKEHVQISFIEHMKEDKLLVLIAMDQNIVIDEAHQLKLLKIKNKKSFDISLRELMDRIDQARTEKSTHYEDYLWYIRARFQPENKRISDQEKYSVFNKHKIEMYQRDQQQRLFTLQQQLRCKYNFLLTYRQSITHHSEKEDVFKIPFSDIMKHKSFQQLIPIHKNSKFPPVIFQNVKDYVGSNDETYFQFVGFLQKWLYFPAVVGLITTLFNIFFEYSADDSPGDFVYSLLIIIWSIYFITSWENEQKWLKIKQSSGYNDEAWSQHQITIEKKGLGKRISRITGRFEQYLPLKQKIQFYFISIGTCVFLSVISIIFMVISLNSRGFVDPDHKLLYFQGVSSWASKGGIFDAQTWWGQVPNLIHVLVTNGFDQGLYRPIAKHLTKIERHLNSKSHSNSIIIKYFIYEFIITFADFFYIAFIRFDIEGLRQQLLSLFFIDIVRRIIAESVIPRLKNRYLHYSLKEKKNQKVPEDQELRHYAILQVNKEHFESFDDYLEIVTNFGYLVMISSCFPLAPLLILFAHFIEIFQDKYKLIHVYRRRLPQKFVGMGYWKNIIVLICYMSIVTNILLFAFSSQQIVSIFPQVFESGKDLVLGNTDFATLFGGAATGMLSAVLMLGNSTMQTMANTLNVFNNTLSLNLLNLQNSTNLVNTSIFLGNSSYLDNSSYPDNSSYLDNNGWGNFTGSQEDLSSFWINPNSTFDNTDSAVNTLHSFHPIPKQHQIQFVGILFFLEHIFLISFILFRNILAKKQNEADLFLERRAYKRKVKKYLSKDVLASNLRDQVVENLIMNPKQQNDVGIFSKLLSVSELGSKDDQKERNTECISQGGQSVTQNEVKIDNFLVGLFQKKADGPSQISQKIGTVKSNENEKEQKIY